MGYYATRAHNGLVAYGDTRQDNCPRSDPRIVTDFDRSQCLTPLITYGHNQVLERMGVRHDDDIWTHEHSVA